MIAVFLCIVVIFIVASAIQSHIDLYDETKRISIARLNESGLVEEPLVSLEEYNQKLKYGIFSEARPVVNVMAICEVFEQNISEHFWMDSDLFVEANRSLDMELVTVTIRVNTSIDNLLVSDYVMSLYSGTQLFYENIDRVVLIVNDVSIYEQTILRMRREMPYVRWQHSDVNDAIEVDVDNNIVYDIDNGKVTMYHSAQEQCYWVYYDVGDMDSGEAVDLFFNAFSRAYEFIDGNPEETTMISVRTADDSVMSGWYDMFRMYQYGYVVNSLEEESRPGYILQYHMTYCSIRGTLKSIIDALFNNIVR